MIFKPNIDQSTPRIKDRHNVRHILLDYLYTIIISLVIAAFLSIIGISKPFSVNLVMSLSFGISICTITVLLFRLINPELNRTLSIILILIASVVGGMIIGSYVGHFMLRRLFSVVISTDGSHVLKTVVMALVFGGTAAYFFYSRVRLKSVSDAAEEERIRRLSIEKEALEGNLRLLQAQIEPHFLFNTLSNVLSLIDTEPAKGKSMLADLISYLRTSLSRTLPETTTLNQEITSIKAYLNIQQIRMGERLNFIIDIPDTIREHPFPPMLLQPLVENAIKHGLESSIEGGEILIKAIEENNLIRIEILDTGVGFSSENNTGVGIRNVRERIKLLYGEKGCFIMEENKPNGVRAIIEVPKHDI
jgi:sensor histidine kinase YesM